MVEDCADNSSHSQHEKREQPGGKTKAISFRNHRTILKEMRALTPGDSSDVLPYFAYSEFLQSWPQFCCIYPNHPKRSVGAFVRYSFRGTKQTDVSAPVKTTIPITQAVFRRTHPLNKHVSKLTGCLISCPC